jgi:divalent metal cation (Fe/Co/Zn/Cd) transporter
MTRRFRPCGNPACSICRYNLEGQPPDSGHPAGEERARDLIAGALAIVLLFVFLFVLLPVMQP